MEHHIPYDKLDLFREKIVLSGEELAELGLYREAFISRSRDFSDYLHNMFLDITETRIIMDRMEDPERLRKFWALWFEKLFSSDLDDNFIKFLWRIGIRHVEVGLDQRFSNLGFSSVRRFCQGVIESEVPAGKRYEIAAIIDKLIDYCLLVETSAYISATTRCDIELIRGIADRVRNKITIIGGYIRMLKRKLSEGDPDYAIYESLIDESAMCEHMVKDINVYNDVFQRTPELKDMDLREAVDGALERLNPQEKFPEVAIDVDLEPGAAIVSADAKDLKQLLHYTLENAFEAAKGQNPRVRISASTECPPEHFVCVEIYNSGTPPGRESLEKFFSPFYTTKPAGSGFGVPISALAARKGYGNYVIVPATDGTKVILTLPAPIRDAG